MNRGQVTIQAVLLLTTALGDARAADWSSVDAARTSLGLSGSIAFDYFSSDHEIDDRANFFGVNLILKQYQDLAWGWSWKGEARLLAQQLGHGVQEQLDDGTRSLRYSNGVVTTELREGYLQGSFGDFEARLGKQIIAWGRADEINPTDVITPKDYLLLLPEGVPAYRTGATAARLDWFPESSLRVSGVWLPVFSQSVIPIGPPPPGAQLTETLPGLAPDDWSGGLKVDASGDVDFSLSYFYGFNLLPAVSLESVVVSPETGMLDARATFVHPRQHMVGADFATAVGRFGLRGEVAWTHPFDVPASVPGGLSSALSYVLGVERNFPDVVSVIVQYVGRWVPDAPDLNALRAGPDPVLGEARFIAAAATATINQQLDTVQNGVAFRIGRLFLRNTLGVELAGVCLFERTNAYVGPKVTYDLTDTWRATVGAEIFVGPEESFFGRVQKNTGAYAGVQYSF